MSEPAERGWTGSLGVRNLLFAVLILFALAPLAVSNTWGHRETQRVLTAAAYRNASNVAALEASRTDEFIRDRRSRLRELGDHLDVDPAGRPSLAAALLHDAGFDRVTHIAHGVEADITPFFPGVVDGLL